MDEKNGICPNCGVEGEGVGNLCSNPSCSSNGYHLIPFEFFTNKDSFSEDGKTIVSSEIGKLIDRYLIVKKLGQGGMGSVYLALQMPLMKEVALKVISAITLDDIAKKRFEREAKAVSVLYHPNIVSLVDFGFDPKNGFPYMALEYVKGGRELSTLMRVRKEQGEKWKPVEIVDIFSQILSGLSVAHRTGLMHRDIKPQNIMLVEVEGNPNMVKILDFGLAKTLGGETEALKLTVQGTILGTPNYMAPEQIIGRGEIDHRCDLYAVGAILFEMLTFKPLFQGATAQEVFAKRLDPDFDPFKEIEPGLIGENLKAFLRKSLAWEPSRRFFSAGEMKESLTAIFSSVADIHYDDGMRSSIEYAPTIQVMAQDVRDRGIVDGKALDSIDSSFLRGGSYDDREKIQEDEEPIISPRRRVINKILWIAGVILGVSLVIFILYKISVSKVSQNINAVEISDAGLNYTVFDATDFKTEVIEEDETGVDERMGTIRIINAEDEEKISGKGEKKGKKGPTITLLDAFSQSDVQGQVSGEEVGEDLIDRDREDATEVLSLQEVPSKGEIEKVFGELRKRIEKCAAGLEEKIGVNATIRFRGKDGIVEGVNNLIVVPTEILQCVKKEIAETKVSPFTQDNFTEVFNY